VNKSFVEIENEALAPDVLGSYGRKQGFGYTILAGEKLAKGH